jgi:hypothetical protein
MVDRDMVTRLRPVFGVLAGLVLLVVSAFSLASADGSVASGAAHDVVTTVEGTVARPAAVSRVPRPVALPVATAAAVALVAILAAYASREGLGRVRPCPGDVGDDWRSLLLGAPPIRA